MKPAIVVVAYNRADSLLRLLSSLEAAVYQEEQVSLLISIDNSGERAVEEAARSFVWSHGEKRLVLHDKRLGLKRHVLECGGYCHQYGSIIMLEDDLKVSEDFYTYSCQALDFSRNHASIGGISLYNHRFNVFARFPFEPVSDGFDNWYFQFASSWGQAWSEEQWSGFEQWLKLHDGEDLHGGGMPDNVADWPESSWLKYAIKYCIEDNKYYLYPRLSLTTNFAAKGEHANSQSADLQVPLSIGHRGDYRFSAPQESKAVYDAYFENAGLDFVCDIYGIRSRDGDFPDGLLLSSQELPFEMVESYALELRPPDANVIQKLRGQDLFLYDCRKNIGKAGGRKGVHGKLERYFYPGLNRKKVLELIKGAWKI